MINHEPDATEALVGRLLEAVERQRFNVAADALACALGIIVAEAVRLHISRLPSDEPVDAAEGVLLEALQLLIERSAAVARVWLRGRTSAVEQH